MKKNIKIIIVNILIFVVLFVVSDYTAYLYFKYNYYHKCPKASVLLYKFPSYLQNYKTEYAPNTIQYLNSVDNIEFRNFILDKFNTKKPILIFGCSFAYSYLLNDNQTFSYKLSKLSHRDVYNFSYEGFGIQHMLYILDKNFYNKLQNTNIDNDTPEYAIFVYIPHHMLRINEPIFPTTIPRNGINLMYKFDKSGNIKLKKYSNSVIYKTFLVKLIFIRMSEYKNRDLNYLLVNSIFEECRNKLAKRFPNIKFVILIYQTDEDKQDLYEPIYMWENIEKEGFIVVKSKDLIGRKFISKSDDTAQDNFHPSEKAWDILVPALIKKLNL